MKEYDDIYSKLGTLIFVEKRIWKWKLINDVSTSFKLTIRRFKPIHKKMWSSDIKKVWKFSRSNFLFKIKFKISKF